MKNQDVYLDTYPLQKDMRIRLPKQILENLHITTGMEFNIYFSPTEKEVILRLATNEGKDSNEN